MQRIPKYGTIRKEPVAEPEVTVAVAPVKRKRQNWDIMHALGDNYMPEEKKPEEPSTDLSMEQSESLAETAREKPPKPIKIQEP